MLRVGYILILVVSLFSCKKDKGESLLDGNIEINNVICYPFDTTSTELRVKVIGGKPPYTYFWNSNTNQGTEKYSLTFKTKAEYFVTVKDADNQTKTFSNIVERKIFDSLLYDHRNNILGSYDCMLTQWSLSPGGSIYHYNPVPYNLIVKKSSDFSKIIMNVGITGNSDVDLSYNNRLGTFKGVFFPQVPDSAYPYDFKGWLKNDSINFTYYISGGYAWRKVYLGKKTN
jgi:hypothetical protein